MFGGKFGHPPGLGPGGPDGVEEVLGGRQGGPGPVLRGDEDRFPRVTRPHQGPVGAVRGEVHVRGERGHVTAAVVEGEEEAPGQACRRVTRAEQPVQLRHPARHVGEAQAVEAGQRRAHDVADPLVRGRGQQPRAGQQLGQLPAAARAEAAQLYVAARGQVEVSVAEPVGGIGQQRQEPVVSRVQAQRAGAGVTALPYDGFVPRCGGRGLGHGGEHTHDSPPPTCVRRHPDQRFHPHHHPFQPRRRLRRGPGAEPRQRRRTHPPPHPAPPKPGAAHRSAPAYAPPRPAPKMTFRRTTRPAVAEDGDMGGSPVRFRRGPATVNPAEPHGRASQELPLSSLPGARKPRGRPAAA